MCVRKRGRRRVGWKGGGDVDVAVNVMDREVDIEVER